MKTRTLGLIAASAVLAMISGCSAPADDQTNDDAPDRVRYIQQSDSLAYIPLYVAIEEGYFEDAGIELDRQPNTGNSAKSVNALIAGQTDIAFPAAAAHYAAAAQDLDIIGIGVLTQQAQSEIILRPEVVDQLEEEYGVDVDSPLADRAAALKGLSLAVYPEGSADRTYLSAVLAQGGLEGSDLDLIPVEPDAIVATVYSGRGDGYMAGLPNSQVAVSEGWGVRWISLPQGEVPGVATQAYVNIVTHGRYLQEHEDVVQRFMEALQKGVDFLNREPDTARAAVQKIFPDMEKSIFDGAYDAVLASFGTSPYPTKELFAPSFETWNAGQEQQVELSFDQIFSATFVK